MTRILIESDNRCQFLTGAAGRSIEALTNEDVHPTVERHCDVAVIGGPAAGLAAALQQVRRRRTVIVVDDGTPRNSPADHLHGHLQQAGEPRTARRPAIQLPRPSGWSADRQLHDRGVATS